MDVFVLASSVKFNIPRRNMLLSIIFAFECKLRPSNVIERNFYFLQVNVILLILVLRAMLSSKAVSEKTEKEKLK